MMFPTCLPPFPVSHAVVRDDASWARDHGVGGRRVGAHGRGVGGGRGRGFGAGGPGRGFGGGRGRARGRGRHEFVPRAVKREPKVAYGSKIKRCVHTGDVSGAFEWFARASERYRRETALGIFERQGGDPRTTCPLGIDETTYCKLISALIKETHADHASEVVRTMAAFGLRMSTRRFTEIIASVPCRTRAKEALAFVDACCRASDFGDEMPSTSGSGGVLEFGDRATATYFTKNVRLLVMEFCEESNQIMDRIKKRSPKSLEQAGTCSLNLVAKPSKLKGGRLCLSTRVPEDAQERCREWRA